jgi:hypothetical protein
LLGTLKGIVVAIVVSMIGLASQTAHPCMSIIGRKRGDRELPRDAGSGRRSASGCLRIRDAS